MSARSDIKGLDIFFGDRRSDFVRICVQKFTYPVIDNIDDANWVTTVLEASVGPFRAKPYEVTLYVSNFRPFLNDLKRFADTGHGCPRLEFLEPWLVVIVGKAEDDHVWIEIELFDEPEGDQKLSCYLEVEVPAVQEIIREIDAVVAAFDPDSRLGGPITKG